MEITDHSMLLECMRLEILDLYNDDKTQENIDKNKLDLILKYIMELNTILDNHEARLRLMERCFNKVKETYFTIDLSRS